MLKPLGFLVFLLSATSLRVYAQANYPVNEDIAARAVTRLENMAELDRYIQNLGHTGFGELDRALEKYARDKSGTNRSELLKVMSDERYNVLQQSFDGVHFFVPNNAPGFAQNAAQGVKEQTAAVAPSSPKPATAPAAVNAPQAPAATNVPTATPVSYTGPGARPTTPPLSAKPSDSPKPASASSSPLAPANEKDFACFYGGFIVRGQTDGKTGKAQKSCKPVSKFTDPRAPGDQKPVQRLDAHGKPIGKPIKLSDLKCGSAQKKVKGKTISVHTREFVECEPMRFGLHADGKPFCMADSPSVGNACKTASKLEGAPAQQWAKAIRDALPGPAAAYDQSVKEICDSRSQESSHWNNMFAKDERQWKDIEATCSSLVETPPLPHTKPMQGPELPTAPTPATPESTTPKQPTSAPGSQDAPGTLREI